ncbi:MAG: hypothetical protein HYR51_13055 [Candidatus Rokubacteria bacterium]|nr:hypothetical protein [Candidatus Rokubacteria bacterium]
MTRLYQLSGGDEIARRRRLLPPGQIAEAWPDLQQADHFWVGEETKALLDAVGAPMRPARALDAAPVRIYYGPRLVDVDSLPREESLQARVLSAGGIAVAWITIDRFGRPTPHDQGSPADPVFYLRRPRGERAHLWRLFRTRDEAIAFAAEGADDPEAVAWARALPAGTFEELLRGSA